MATPKSSIELMATPKSPVSIRTLKNPVTPRRGELGVQLGAQTRVQNAQHVLLRDLRPESGQLRGVPPSALGGGALLAELGEEALP